MPAADPILRPAADTPALAAAVQASEANRAEAFRAGWNAALTELDAQVGEMHFDSGGMTHTNAIDLCSNAFGIAIRQVVIAILALAKDPPDAP